MMTLDEMRLQMDRWWPETDARANAMKNSQSALMDCLEFYERLAPDEKSQADTVLGEWLLSDIEAKRYDAIATIRRFRIRSAVPQLKILASHLQRRTAPPAVFDLEHVRDVLQSLTEATPAEQGSDDH